MDASPVNQLVVSGNACGPAALLTAFRFGGESWRAVYASLPGEGERGKIRTLIRDIGMRPSGHLPGRARWSRGGVNLADLQDMANEISAERYQPYLSQEVFFRRENESAPALLRRVHHRLERSLAKGFPPVLSLRRHAGNDWRTVEAHFVTVIAVPRSLDRGATSFPVTYIDPWGGRRCEGRIGIPQTTFLTNGAGEPACLEAEFPQSSVGKPKVRRGERTALAVSAALGRW